MKTIGVLGGMSSQATAEYYRMINEGVNRQLGGWNTAEIIISSVNFANIERFVRSGDWQAAGDYLHAKAHGLEQAGADFVICVSNTLHRVAAAFTRDLSIPLLHIVDPTAAALNRAGLMRGALIGTKPVMGADYLKQRFIDRHGIEIIVPNESDQVEVDRIIFDELVKGQLLPQSRVYLVTLLKQLQDNEGATAAILGCTEFALLLRQENIPTLPLFDTAALHVEAAVEMALGQFVPDLEPWKG